MKAEFALGLLIGVIGLLSASVSADDLTAAASSASALLSILSPQSEELPSNSSKSAAATYGSLRCYRCIDPSTGTGEAPCSSPRIDTCTVDLPQCITWTTVYYGVSITVKSCGYLSRGNGCFDNVALTSEGYTTPVSGRACMCSTDLCNGYQSVPATSFRPYPAASNDSTKIPYFSYYSVILCAILLQILTQM